MGGISQVTERKQMSKVHLPSREHEGRHESGHEKKVKKHLQTGEPRGRDKLEHRKEEYKRAKRTHRLER